MQREGVFREMKQRRAYEKPSEKKLDYKMNPQEDLKNCFEKK